MTVPALGYIGLTAEQQQLGEAATGAFDTRPKDPCGGSDLGLFGIGVPETSGGVGGSWADLAVVIEAAGATLSASLAGWQAGVVLPLMADGLGADPALATSLAHGASTVGIPLGSLWEHLAQWDVARERLSGSWLVMAPLDVGYVVVPAIADGNPALVLCPVSDEAAVIEEVHGMDVSCPLSRVTLRDFPVSSASALVAAEDLFDHWLRRVSLVAALDAVGVARQALDRTIEYSHQRQQFGRPIGSFQAYKHRCASLFILLKQAQAVSFRAAREFDQPDGSVLALSAGVFAPASATFITGDAVQLHGGMGFTWEAGLHAYLKRARTDEIMASSGGVAARELISKFRIEKAVAH